MYDEEMTEEITKRDVIEIKSIIESMRNHPLYLKVAELCEKHGYTLSRMHVSKHGLPDLRVYAKERNYHPNIYLTETNAACSEFKFEIQTTSYGSLSVEEYDEFLLGCNNARHIVGEISKIEYSEWPQIDL